MYIYVCVWVGVHVEYEKCYSNTCGVFDSPSLPRPITHFVGVGVILFIRTTAWFTVSAAQYGSHMGLFGLKFNWHRIKNSILQSDWPHFTCSGDTRGL